MHTKIRYLHLDNLSAHPRYSVLVGRLIQSQKHTHTGYQAQRTIHVLKQVNSVTSDNGAATMVYLFIRTTSGTQISVPGTKMSYVPL